MPSCGVSFIMSTSYTCSRLEVFQKFTMKTVFPSPGPPSTTIIPPLVWACSTKSTALDRSFDLPKNCLCIASWWTSCSNTSDAASASSASCEMCNYEVFIESISKVQHWRKSKNKDTEVDHIRRFYLHKQNQSLSDSRRQTAFWQPSKGPPAQRCQSPPGFSDMVSHPQRLPTHTNNYTTEKFSEMWLFQDWKAGTKQVNFLIKLNLNI